MKIFRDICKKIWGVLKLIWLRIVLYALSLFAGGALLCYMQYKDYIGGIREFLGAENNDVFLSAMTIFIVTFPVVTLNWILKNYDTTSQLEKASEQLEKADRQHSETLFSNARYLLFEEKIHAKSIGLMQLIQLRQQGTIESERIDMITKSRLDLQNANLQFADLQGAELQNANLQGANLLGAKLQNAKLLGAKLQGAKLQKANLQNAKLQVAELQNAELQVAELQNAELQNANLQGTNLLGAKLQNAELQNASLQGTNLQVAELQNAELQNAKLQGADLLYASLQETNLQGADLQGADLQGAELGTFKVHVFPPRTTDLRGAMGIDCGQLQQAKDWHLAYRDAELACGKAIPTPKDE